MEIPPNVNNLSRRKVRLKTFFEPLSASIPKVGRSNLLVVPSKPKSFEYFLGSDSIHTDSSADKLRDAKAKQFAYKPHGYSHLHIADMLKICERAKVLTPELKKHLKAAYDK